MEKLEQHEANKLIALFMGFKEEDIQAEEWCGCNVRSECKVTGDIDMIPANYHENWQWLMPVIEKISTVRYHNYYGGYNQEEDDKYDDTAYLRTFGMRDKDGNYLVRINACPLYTAPTLIEATYTAVIEFIKWYNSVNPPQ